MSLLGLGLMRWRLLLGMCMGSMGSLVRSWIMRGEFFGSLFFFFFLVIGLIEWDIDVDADCC
jgi:hypothetical protein